MTDAPDQFQELISRLRADPSLAKLLRPEAAVLVWDDGAHRLLWASPAAADFTDGLVDREGFLNPDSRVQPRLEKLAGGLAPRHGVRLERLLLDPGRLIPPVTCGCRLAALESGANVLVTAIVGPLPRRRGINKAPTAGSMRAQRLAGPKSAGSVRFVWQTDPHTRFTHVSSGLSEVVGPISADIVGRTWAEITRAVVEEPNGDVAALFARQETWSGRTIAWSVDGKTGKIPVDWAGMPILGPDRELLGFRGFGLLWMDALPELADAIASSDVAMNLSDPAEAVEDQSAEADRALTDEEKLFEEIRETVAACLSESTIDLSPALEEPETSPTAAPPPEPRSGLSNTERHAFREIAKALGARFDADSAATSDRESDDEPSPFPGLVLVPDEDDDADDRAASDVAPLSETVEGKAERVDIRIAPATRLPATDGRALLAQLPLPALVHRQDHIVFANRALLDLAEYDSPEHLAVAGGLPGLFDGGPDGFVDARLITRQRNSMPVELHRASVLWEGVEADLLLLRLVPEDDVSERLRAAEADLRVRNQRIGELESVLDTATDGVVLLDETGRILSLNRSAEALFGYNQSDVVGDAVTVLLSPESHREALDYLEGLRSPGVAGLMNDGREVLGRVRQGGAIPLFMTMGALNDGPDRKLCAVLRDITPFKKAEGELVGARRMAEQANAQKSDLLAKISHEIRTPLNAILGFAEVMLEQRFGPIGNDRYKEYLKDVHASGAHVISLVNDLLDLAKVEAGRMDLAFTSVGLNELVSNCFTLLQPQAARDRIVMRTSFAAKLPSVVADDRSMRQIVLNLVSNAIKFTDAGGQVIVSTALTDCGEVAFRVRDTGIGMSSDEIQAALEPFRQLATSRKRGGTGLGLPLTKALVEANRGALQISSQPNEGTLVEVIFPPAHVLAG